MRLIFSRIKEIVEFDSELMRLGPYAYSIGHCEIIFDNCEITDTEFDNCDIYFVNFKNSKLSNRAVKPLAGW